MATHILTRAEAIVAAELLGNFNNLPNAKVSNDWRALPVDQRIAAAMRLQMTLTNLLESTSDYFTIESK